MGYHHNHIILTFFIIISDGDDMKVWDAMSSSDAVLYVRSKLQQSRHRHQLPLSAVGQHHPDNKHGDHHVDNNYEADADWFEALILTKIEEVQVSIETQLWKAKDSKIIKMQNLFLSKVCEDLLDTCCSKTVDKFGKNSCDNMTVILILPGNQSFVVNSVLGMMRVENPISRFLTCICSVNSCDQTVILPNMIKIILMIKVFFLFRSLWRRIRHKQLSPFLSCL